MTFVTNPYSQCNATGFAIAGLSFCLLGIDGPGGTWLERHALFVMTLGLGLLLSALYVRSVVDPEKRSLSVIVGVWPLKFVRPLDVESVDDVFIDVGGVRTSVSYKTYVRWISSRGTRRRTLLTATGPEAVKTGVQVAQAIGVPVTTSEAFQRGAGEESRKLVVESKSVT